VIAAGRRRHDIWLSPDDWSNFAEPPDVWISEAAEALAQAITSLLAVIDFEAIVIDGAFPADVRGRLLRKPVRSAPVSTGRASPTQWWWKVRSGVDARAIGGAALPLLATFAPDHDVLFKD